MDSPKELQPDTDAAVLKLGSKTGTPAEQRWWERVRERFLALTLNQKVGVGAGLLALLVALVLSLSSLRPAHDYRVLFANLNDADGASVVAALQQMNVPYQFTPGGAAILVPENLVHETRLKLAGQGLPKAGNVGYELLENQKFGTSQFVERVNYQRGLEGELARSIASLGQVKTARVHLAIPKQTAFIREQERPSASVVLALHPGRMLDPAQVAAVTRLVSSAVPGMQPQDVSIVDSEGGILAPVPQRDAGLDAAQLKYTAELESALNRRLVALLEPLAGKDGFRSQVTVDLNFDERERTAETYGKNSPPNEQSIRSERTLQATGGRTGPGGIPGSLTNQPPQPPEAPIANATATTASGQPPENRALRAPGEVETGIAVSPETAGQRSERTVNYEVDRAIERLKTGKGQIRRVSAAVVLDHKLQKGAAPDGARKVPFTADEIRQIDALVKDAIGYLRVRGDTVSVVNLPFSEEVVVETPLLTPDLLSQLIRYGAIALAVLFAWFAVVRPLIRPPKPEPVPEPRVPPTEPEAKLEPEPEPELPPLSPLEQARKEMADREAAWAAEQELHAFKEKQEALQREREESLAREREQGDKRRYDALVEYAASYAREHDESAALLLRAWTAESSGGNPREEPRA